MLIWDEPVVETQTQASQQINTTQLINSTEQEQEQTTEPEQTTEQEQTTVQEQTSEQERSIEQIDTTEQGSTHNVDNDTSESEDYTTEPKIDKPLNSKKRKRFSFVIKAKSSIVDSSQSPKSSVFKRPKTVRGKEMLKRLAEASSEDEDEEPFNYLKGITNYAAIEANMRLYREYNNPARRVQDFEAEIAKITDADVEKEVLRFWEEHDIANRKRKSKKDKTDARLRLEYKIRRVCRSQNMT